MLQEIEYLFPPISFLQLTGEQQLECTPDGPVQLVPVRINANLKTLTVEEICAQKKTTHLASFDFLVDELIRDLHEQAESAEARTRAAADPHADQVSRFQLVERIVAQCYDVRQRHAGLDAAQYLDDDAYRTLVTEALASKEMGKDKFALWLQGADPARFLLDHALRTCQRRRNMLRERQLATLEGDERVALALELCRSKGLVQEAIGEQDSYGEVPLLTAAANGERRDPAAPSCLLFRYMLRNFSRDRIVRLILYFTPSSFPALFYFTRPPAVRLPLEYRAHSSLGIPSSHATGLWRQWGTSQAARRGSC